ncbi:MAG TPA: hypothetical protein PLE45_07955 [Spirochaetota bacterium]|nr:hypothetical protein [Spirochaetota bacterium]HOL57096.1 hypothetical protein [Spirochaetota bacterium]HPP04672.1 hypothetical protein [Spirochaetota bacterium]
MSEEKIDNVSISYEKKLKELEERKETLKKNYNKIETFFRSKESLFEKFKHIPVDEIVQNAPKYYPLIRVIEQINAFLNNDVNWFKRFINNSGIKFDWEKYEKWKAGVDFYKTNYDDTYCPTKWIQLVLDKFIEILKQLQILLYLECYVDEDDFKKFLKKHPDIDFKIKANYVNKSLPSEDIDSFFKLINDLIKVNIENNLSSKLIIDTRVCMDAYRKIDNSKIFELLKRKEFYIKYRLEFLKLTSVADRFELPYEEDIISVGNTFLETYKDLAFIYKEYKDRLIEKYNKISAKVKK